MRSNAVIEEAMRPQIEMTDEKVALLMRSALLEDASNINERFAALTAEIKVDDDMILVTLTDELWPDVTNTVQAEAVAKMLWLEIEWNGTVGTFPFVWPGIGEHTTSTTEYFKMVLDAHAGRPLKG